ncbi:hypothetical protein AB7813_30410 [Tardiphaga sp. 20_F10_N6_6]
MHSDGPGRRLRLNKLAMQDIRPKGITRMAHVRPTVKRSVRK